MKKLRTLFRLLFSDNYAVVTYTTNGRMSETLLSYEMPVHTLSEAIMLMDRCMLRDMHRINEQTMRELEEAELDEAVATVKNILQHG